MKKKNRNKSPRITQRECWTDWLQIPTKIVSESFEHAFIHEMRFLIAIQIVIQINYCANKSRIVQCENFWCVVGSFVYVLGGVAVRKALELRWQFQCASVGYIDSFFGTLNTSGSPFVIWLLPQKQAKMVIVWIKS